jgi:hypothetical protein
VGIFLSVLTYRCSSLSPTCRQTSLPLPLPRAVSFFLLFVAHSLYVRAFLLIYIFIYIFIYIHTYIHTFILRYLPLTLYPTSNLVSAGRRPILPVAVDIGGGQGLPTHELHPHRLAAFPSEAPGTNGGLPTKHCPWPSRPTQASGRSRCVGSCRRRRRRRCRSQHRSLPSTGMCC